jgi:hypothetical protein
MSDSVKRSEASLNLYQWGPQVPSWRAELKSRDFSTVVIGGDTALPCVIRQHGCAEGFPVGMPVLWMRVAFPHLSRTPEFTDC